ncbi:hypothetical protein Q8A73_003197 [Channa argus]|nr:hypothetical protein Q8A73_003197 [Channa argus]
MEMRQKRVAKLWTTALQMGQPEPDGGPKSKEDPSVINGRHTAEEPSGERKQEQNDKESWGGSKRHGKIPLRGNCPRRASATKGIKEMRALDGKQANNHWDPFLPPFKH